MSHNYKVYWTLVYRYMRKCNNGITLQYIPPYRQPSHMPEIIMTWHVISYHVTFGSWTCSHTSVFCFFLSDGLVVKRLISTVWCPLLELFLIPSVRNLIGHSSGPLLGWTRKRMRAWRNITTHSLPCVNGSAECRSRLKQVRGNIDWGHWEAERWLYIYMYCTAVQSLK